MTIAVLLGMTMASACHHNQTLQSPAGVPQKRTVSPESAALTAVAYLKEKKEDVSRYDMSAPDGIQEIQIRGRKAWRISWKLKELTGKGGQLIVIVDDTGKAEQGWGE